MTLLRSWPQCFATSSQKKGERPGSALLGQPPLNGSFPSGATAQIGPIFCGTEPPGGRQASSASAPWPPWSAGAFHRRPEGVPRLTARALGGRSAVGTVSSERGAREHAFLKREPPPSVHVSSSTSIRMPQQPPLRAICFLRGHLPFESVRICPGRGSGRASSARASGCALWGAGP